MTPPALDLLLPPHSVTAEVRFTASAARLGLPWTDLSGRVEGVMPTTVASARATAPVSDVWADAITAVQNVAALRAALGMRDADAVDRWAAARVAEMYAVIIPDDEVVEITPEQLIRGEF